MSIAPFALRRERRHDRLCGKAARRRRMLAPCRRGFGGATRTGLAMQRFSIRTILLLLVLVVALPLAAGLAHLTQQRLAGRTEFALEVARGSAQSARALIDLVIAEAQGLAARLASHDCAAVANFDLGPYAYLGTLALVDRTGAVICRSGPVPSTHPISIGKTAEFRHVSATRTFAMGDPSEGPLSGRWEVLVVQPRFDARGDWVGAVAVAIDLAGLEELLQRRLLDARDVIAVTTADGSRYLARTIEPAKWIGRKVELPPALVASIVKDGERTLRRIGIDGRHRLGAIERVAATGWFVYAGLDGERVVANIVAQQRAAAIAFAAIVAGALLLGLWLSHRIARPIAALAEAAPAANDADAPTHVPVGGPKEVAAVARRLNEAAAARFAAEADLRKIERLNRHFLQYSTVVYARVGADGRYQSANRIWLELFSEPGVDVVGRHFGEFVLPEEAVRRREQLAEVIRTKQPVTREQETTTRRGRRAFVSTLFPILDESGAVEAVGIVAIDVTERRDAERAREQFNAILTRVTEAVPVCLSYIDADERFAWTNSRNAERLGLARDWIVGRAVRDVMPDRYAEVAPLIAMVREGKTLHDEVTWPDGNDGSLIYERISMPDFDANGGYRGHTVVWLDVTERKRAAEREHDYAERMRALSRRLLEAQEAERRAIARELHDEVGQALTAVQAMLQALARTTKDVDAAARIAENEKSVNRVIDEIRSASMRLRPSVLDDLGLVPALRWLAAQQGRAAGLEIALALDALSADVPPQIATACFRIAQEAITNAIRYARAHRVQLRLAERGDDLAIEIADDGAGFALGAMQARAAAGEASGITGMRERAELLGGTFEIDAAPGRGTVVRALFPLVERSAEHAAAHAG